MSGIIILDVVFFFVFCTIVLKHKNGEEKMNSSVLGVV